VLPRHPRVLLCRVRKRRKLAERVEAAVRLPCRVLLVATHHHDLDMMRVRVPLRAGQIGARFLIFFLCPCVYIRKASGTRLYAELLLSVPARLVRKMVFPSNKDDYRPLFPIIRYDQIYRFSREHDIPSFPSYAYMSPSLYITCNL
jgi:hypothetical protein